MLRNITTSDCHNDFQTILTIENNQDKDVSSCLTESSTEPLKGFECVNVNCKSRNSKTREERFSKNHVYPEFLVGTILFLLLRWLLQKFS
jgi:hypothetical protein